MRPKSKTILDSGGFAENRVVEHQAAIVRLLTEPLYQKLPSLHAIQATLELASTVLEVERGSAWFLEDDGSELRCVDLYELESERHSSGAVLAARDFPAYFDAVHESRAVAADFAQTDERTREFIDGYLRPLNIVSMLDAAIRRHGKTFGVLCFEKTAVARNWTLDEVSFTGQVADHIDRILLEEERFATQDALRVGERTYRGIFNSTSDALFIHAEDGRLIDVNDRACRMFRCDRETLLSKSVAEFSLGESPYSGIEAQANLERAAREGMQTFEWMSRRADGELFWAEVSLRAGEIGGEPKVVASVRDISERKAAETEQQKLLDQLQHMAKMDAVGRLAGGIAHDFNNVLTNIMVSVELLQLDLDPNSSLNEGLAVIGKAATTAESLTSQLLAFTRQQVIKPRILDINVEICELRPMLSCLIGEEVTLDLKLAPDLGTVEIDQGQFSQIVMNLALNARDAMSGGGCLELITKNVQVDLSECARLTGISAGPYVMFSVRDNGEGMDAELVSKIFEPFFTTKEMGRGTGLGLATIFGAVRQVNGAIDVDSQLGDGSTFSVYLPRAADKVQPAKPDEGAKELTSTSATVLLVEDNAEVRELALRVLLRLGYRVLPADNGVEAMAIADREKESIDVVLTDVVMPEMNGRELVEQIKKVIPSVGVVFTSGYTSNVLTDYGVSPDSFEFLSKPYTIRALSRVLDRVVNQVVNSG